MIFRKACLDDLDFFCRLRNDEASVRFSKRGHLSSDEIRKDYFENPFKIAFVAVVDDCCAGYLILEKLDAASVEISVAVVPELRGHGLGKALVKEGTEFATALTGIKKVIAKIYKANRRSYEIFIANSYRVLEAETELMQLEYVKPENTYKQSDCIVVFDFDGVIVDSVKALFHAYESFLAEFSMVGSLQEFELLNGPRLHEIIAYLKSKYSLKPEYDVLEKLYKQKIAKAYANAKPVKNIAKVLESLHKKGIKIALASSSDRCSIEKFLKKFVLLNYFEHIITGDEVKHAKPSPEIYEIIKDKFPGFICFAVEDSKNGIEAARSAGMISVWYRPEGSNLKIDADLIIDSIEQIEGVVEEPLCVKVAQAERFELVMIDNFFENNHNDLDIVDRIWNNDSKERWLTNGRILGYGFHEIGSSGVVINCYAVDYKMFWAQLRSFSLNFGIKPVAVSGIIMDPQGKTLLGRRKNSSEYDSMIEFVPAGGIEVVPGEKPDYQRQLLKELEEESGINSSVVSRIEPVCLLYDTLHCVYDICAVIRLERSLDSLNLKECKQENHGLEILSLSEIDKKVSDMVPASRVLYRTVLNKGLTGVCGNA